MISGSRKNLFWAALSGAVLAYCINYWLADSGQQQKIAAMESKIRNLESLLAQAENDSRNAQPFSINQGGSNHLTVASQVNDAAKHAKDNGQGCAAPVDPAVVNSVKLLRNLETGPENDSRTFAQKINDLLAGNPTREKIAIASKGIFDMARDREHLPDYALQSIYSTQTDPDLKRVVAQVMAQRGNDTLLNDQVEQAQAKLKSDQPRDRQDALVQLGKLRNVKAADAILPYLNDPDVNVRLDALLALRNTGNEQDASYVEMMRNDPNPAVSSLATDVASDLKDLSTHARTSMSSSDIEAGLPPM
ncbi:MAG: HEAT repeat domain-containing protein [Steroidobacter sp.]